MRVLLTRPRPDAESLAAKLQALGHTAFVEPLLDIVFIDGPKLDLAGVQALLLTSANGARAAARRTHERAMTVLAVGPATAAEATTLGFADLRQSTGEGVEGLARFAHATLKPANGALLHVTGTVSAGDLKASLSPFGFTVRIERLYDAREAQSLSGALAAELGAGQIDAAMFFSPRTANLFATLVAGEGLEQACAAIDALALSQAVADALAPLVFRQIRVAALANTEAMLDLLASRA
jgi:uroporphyrinogen-III synthase